MNYFYYSGKNNKLKTAVNAANIILRSEEFFQRIAAVPNFDYSRDEDGIVTGKELVAILRRFQIKSTVIGYRGWWWSRVYGYYKGGKSIFINTRKLNRSIYSIIGTLIHEYIHVVDNYYPGYLGHGNNSSRGKSLTVPWTVGRIASVYWREKVQELENENGNEKENDNGYQIQ